jgi:hypothetical protein
VNYNLCAANGITIPTYDWLSPSLNQGLCQDFTWQLMVADGTHHPIDVDFLSHFSLLVDCKHNRLLDKVTPLFVSAQATISLIPSIKTISGGTSVDSLLAKFPVLTRPAKVQHEVLHNPVNTRPTSHLPTMATGTGPARYWQSRV